MSDRTNLARLRHQIQGNVGELSAPDLALDPRRVQQVAQAERAFLTGHSNDVKGRDARRRDGHGELRTEHIFLGTPTEAAGVIDCVEFDAELCRLDPAEESTFLTLEYAQLGAMYLTAPLHVRRAYATHDPAPRAALLLRGVPRRRAHAKLAAWHLAHPALAGQERKCRGRVHAYLAEALRHLTEADALARAAAAASPASAASRRTVDV